MRRVLFAAIAVLSAALLGAPFASAQQAPAPSASLGAAAYDLEYEASLLNIVTLGRASISAAVTPTAYRLSATMQTGGFASLFDDTRLSASAGGSRLPGRLMSASYSLSHAYAGKSRRVSMQRANGAFGARVAPAYRDLGVPPATPAQINASDDPLSVLGAMSADIARRGACAGRRLVFDGKQHYALSLAPSARGTYSGGGYHGAAIVCRLRYEPIAGFKAMSAAERAQIPTAEIWFAADSAPEFAPILRIAIPTPVGEARLDLKRLKRPA